MNLSKELFKYTSTLSLLFVEDHEELRVNVSKMLKDLFKSVDIAVDGENGLAMYKNKYNTTSKYDIVITDIRMPKMDGVALTKNIYQIDKSQAIIVLSAHDESEHLLELINLGIAQFIKKPLDYKQLQTTLLNVSKKMASPTERNEEIKLAKKTIYDRKNSFLSNKGENVYLTKYEILFMQLLTQNIGKIHSNEDISQHFEKQNEKIDAKNIRKLVSKLRKKLPKDCLGSIYGIGYKIMTI